MNMKKLTYFSLLIMASMAIISCGSKTGQKTSQADSIASKSEAKTDKSSASAIIENALKSATGSSEKADDGKFLRSDAIEKAFDALKAMPKFKGKKVMVFQDITFYDFQGGRITLSISDPNKPDNIDQYEYTNGAWGDPAPINLSGDGKVSDNLTNLDEINYKAIPNMMKIADEKAKGVEGGKVGNMISFSYMPALNMRFFQLPDGIKGTRESYNLRFDKAGNVSEFKKN